MVWYRSASLALLLLTVAVVQIAPPPATAGSFPSPDPTDANRLLGGEVVAFAFDARDMDLTQPGSVRDVSSSGSDAVLLDNVARVAGVGHTEQAARMTSNPARVQILDETAVRSITSDFSITAWVRLDAITGAQYLYVQRAASMDLLNVNLANGAVTVTLRSATNIHLAYNLGPHGLGTGTWHHVAIVASPSSISYAVDGNSVNSVARVQPGVYTAAVASYAAIGHYPTFANSFGGAVDEFRMYKRALANDEIRSIMDLPYLHLNTAPVANAGADIAADCGNGAAVVTLDGTASTDDENDTLTYTWNASTALDMGNASAAATNATFGLGSHAVTLTVEDGEFSDRDTVNVHVLDGAPPNLGNVFPAEEGVYAGSAHVGTGNGGIVVLGSVDISADATDACSGVDRVRFAVDDGTVVDDDEAPYGFTYAPAGLGIQYRTVTISAVDAVGNTSPPVVVDLTVFATAPKR